MLFSIVIPTYNRSSYLERCIGSLFKEIHSQKDIEVLVVDDGSSEEEQKRNREICSEAGVEYFANPNGGQGVARNAGVKKSTGKWIVFLDDDVVIVEGWYRKLKKWTGSVNHEVVGFEGAVIPSGDGVWDREVQNLKGGLYLTCHIIYRRSVFEQVGCFDEREIVRKAEDHHLAAKVLKTGRIMFVPELKVVHLPRTVPFWGYIKGAFRRMDTLLIAEKSFFSKEPSMYSRFRHANTFWGTYRSILFRYVLSSLRRRDARRLLSHPAQTFVLICALLLEQLRAWMLLPGYLLKDGDSCLKKRDQEGCF